jgi:tRNA pseudouridine38-40 synthase
MQKFKLTIEYEGTRYSGWQVQKNARTVQGELLAAARSVLKTADLELYGAGRTDAGVHAIAQVAHLQVTTMLAPHIIRMKMNDELPADINILEAERIHPNFHARHDAIARSYLYQISRRRTALGKRFVWWIKDELDVKLMNAAASKFLGLKNFQSFTADEPEEKSTKALIEEFQLKAEGALILIRIVGSHFLWKQVRQIVGVLAEVGRGKLSEADIERFLNEPSDEPAKFTAPPSGLFLERVYYKGDARDLPLLPVMAI